MAKRLTITAERLRELLDYDHDTGLFTWKPRPIRKHTSRTDKSWNGRYAGSPAGCKKGHGYIKIAIDDVQHYAHRLAWIYVTGEDPDDQIDHINLNRSDNRFSNLRPATQKQNFMNKRPRSTTGFKGVYRSRNRFIAKIFVDGVNIHLGMFDTAEEAGQAYIDAARKYHGEYIRTE